MRAKPIYRNPRHIGHFYTVRSFDRTFCDHTSTLELLTENGGDFRLKTSVPVGCRTHNDLVKAIRFNLIGQILQGRVFAYFFPGSHSAMMRPRPLSRNIQFALS